MFSTCSKTVNDSISKQSRFACVLLDHTSLTAHGKHTRALDVGRMTYDTYIYIYIQRNSAVELTSVGLAHARPYNVIYCIPYNLTMAI